jgi:signal transduction histidine kinase
VESRFRSILYLVGLTLLGVIVLSVFWEFYLEDLVVPHIYEYYHSEPLYERVEYVLTALMFGAIAIIFPAWLLWKSMLDADQARALLSSANQDLELRVQERTRELVETNGQLEHEIEQRQQYEESLRESEKELRLLSSRLLTVQENERRRIALDLHDNVSQTLVAMKFRIEHALDAIDQSTGKSADLSAMLVPVVQETIDEVRAMYMRLRPSILDDLGLLATLTWLCRNFKNANPAIALKSEFDIAESEIPDNLKVVIFRVVQEGLNNVVRHSKADQVSVSLTRKNGNVELTVQDNGIGIDLKAVLSVDDSLRGTGLSSMRERIQLVGGSFRITGEEGEGTQIHASWPA